MGTKPPQPQLPDGVDDEEYKRIRKRMRASVLRVWAAHRDLIAGLDPWDVVDEAWASMAEKNFKCKGPFLPFALRVAKNKAVDALRAANARRGDQSLDAPLWSGDEDGEVATLHDTISGSESAEAVHLRGLDDVAIAEKLALAEEAIYQNGILTDVERYVFVAVRVERRSGVAVGRELDCPVTGQRVGQIVARAFIKIQAYVTDHEEIAEAPDAQKGEGG